MSYHVRRTGREQHKAKPRRLSLQKPNGVISPRVRKVGGEHFGIVCVDPAKLRSEWMMADYFGNLLIEPQTVEHQIAFFKIAMKIIWTGATTTRHSRPDRRRRTHRELLLAA